MKIINITDPDEATINEILQNGRINILPGKSVKLTHSYASNVSVSMELNITSTELTIKDEGSQK